MPAALDCRACTDEGMPASSAAMEGLMARAEESEERDAAMAELRAC